MQESPLFLESYSRELEDGLYFPLLFVKQDSQPRAKIQFSCLFSLFGRGGIELKLESFGEFG